jgi:hypothetical protein
VRFKERALELLGSVSTLSQYCGEMLLLQISLKIYREDGIVVMPAYRNRTQPPREPTLK